jgi:tripartite-type tricarboxylate transporter receptor subunit TctC
MKGFWGVLGSIFFVAAAVGWAGPIQAAEKYPVRPITFVVPLETGSGGDLTTRQLIGKASASLGQPIMVVNKPGAASTIGYYQIHDAKPDGYTIGLGTATLLTNKLQGLFPYDYRDFTPIGTYYCWSSIVVASTKSKRSFKTIAEAVSYAKSRPGEVSMATAAVGQAQWIAAMAFIESAGVNLNLIPQEGVGGFTVAQVAGGHTDLGVLDFASAKGQIDAKNIRILAVIGSKRIPPPYDSAPTLKESGYDAIWESFGMVMAPPKLPKEITDKLVKAFEGAVKDPEYEKFISQRNSFPFYLSPDQIMKYCEERQKVVQNIMQKAGIKKEK